jgi:hypothetical protein
MPLLVSVMVYFDTETVPRVHCCLPRWLSVEVVQADAARMCEWDRLGFSEIFESSPCLQRMLAGV